MLPDFPEQKKRLADLYTRILREARAGASVVSQCTHTPVHEGKRDQIIREDGTQDPVDFRRLEATMEIHRDEFPSLTPAKLVERYRQLGQEMAREQMKVLIETLNRTCEESGQKVDGKGEPFTIELWMEMLEKMELPFGEDGELKESFCLIHPKMAERVKAEAERLEREPGLRRRYEELKARKRRLWLDREAARKLVG